MKKARPQRYFMSITAADAELLQEVGHLGPGLFCGRTRTFSTAGGVAATALPGLLSASAEQPAVTG
jgi:hypothetical protein